MKTYLLDIQDKRLLNKRSLIESVFNVLKKHMHLEILDTVLLLISFHIIALASYPIYNLILILSLLLLLTSCPKLMFLNLHINLKH
ncbi:putative transposase [Orientia tsutsugamushi str. UT76]|nr:putative transposase [Orientia tsutsugamushi str. UT76]